MVEHCSAMTVHIGGRAVGPGRPCFVIAEAGVNHNGDVAQAHRLVDAAVEAKADAVKFQTFSADRLASTTAPKAEYQQQTTDPAESQQEMLRRLELSASAHRELLEHCREKDLAFLSSPFDQACADLLEEMDVPAFKIPSGEITNLSYLKHIAAKGRPMVVSTGMANLSEVEAAVEAVRSVGEPGIVLLHCVSNYPADPADVNLRAMHTMQQAFGVPVGYSDHVPRNEVAFAAVALGACVVEKHFTLDHSLPGPDHKASLEPNELAALVEGVRMIERALGDGRKRPAASEADTAAVARKSLVAAHEIPAGTVLTEAMIAVKRPGTGLPPVMQPHLVGRTARETILADALLTLEMLR